MDYKFFMQGIKNIIFDPAKAWEIIDTQNKPVKVIRDSFVLPLIILVSLSAFAGSLIFSGTGFPPIYSVFTGIRTFLVLYCTVYVTAVIFGEVTFPLDLGRDFHISFRIISFSLAPFLLCLILSNLFESLLFINIIGLYGLYIFWAGAGKLLDPPQYKKMPLLIATTVTAVFIYISATVVLKMLFERIYYAFFD